MHASNQIQKIEKKKKNLQGRERAWVHLWPWFSASLLSLVTSFHGVSIHCSSDPHPIYHTIIHPHPMSRARAGSKPNGQWLGSMSRSPLIHSAQRVTNHKRTDPWRRHALTPRTACNLPAFSVVPCSCSSYFIFSIMQKFCTPIL